MKKCPQYGREYDNTMSFCLDDGAELLYGPVSVDEPATAIAYHRCGRRGSDTSSNKHHERHSDLERNQLDDMSPARMLDWVTKTRHSNGWKKPFRPEDLTFTRWGIPYESLRDDSRYKDLLRRMGLLQ